MNTVLIILAVVLLLLIVIALLKVRLVIDTVEDRYELLVVPFARVRLILKEDAIGYRWNAVLMHGQGQLFPPLEKAEKKERAKKHERRNTNRMAFKDVLNLGKALWKGLEVHRIYLRLNTDDAVWNAWLFPAFALWHARGHDVAIQWVGDSILVLDMEHSVHRVAGAFIHSYLTKTRR